MIIEEADIDNYAGPVVQEYFLKRAEDGKSWYAVTPEGDGSYIDFDTAKSLVREAAMRVGRQIDRVILEDAVHDSRYS